MAFADAPYNLISDIVGRGKRKHREFVAGSGEQTSQQFTQFLANSLEHCAAYSMQGALIFCCMDWRHMQEILSAGQQARFELKNLAVWVKNTPGQGSLYRSQHELVFIFKNGDSAHQNNIGLGRHGRNRSNVWEYPRVDTFRTGPLAELTSTRP